MTPSPNPAYHTENSANAQTPELKRHKQVCVVTDDEMGALDATGLRERLRRKEISPAELIQCAIKRARAADRELNAIATECFSAAQVHGARWQSKQAGYFRGIPCFVKDNQPVAGLPTRYGSKATMIRPEKRNGAYTRQFLSVGGICLGKSTMPEFGFNATTEPEHGLPTRNPWQTDYSCGASSGGSAALVAAGAVPFAHANDGGGSIRIPAACCGLVGMKPTRERHVISEQARMMPLNLIGEGIVSRSVRDTARFHFEAEKYYRNRALPPMRLVEGPAKARRKIALITDSITGYATDHETRTAVETAAARLAAVGHHIEEIRFPVSTQFIEDFALYWASLAFSTYRAGRLIMQPGFRGERTDSLTQGLAGMFGQHFYKLPALLSRLKKTAQQCEEIHQRYDFLLSPVLAHTPPRLGHLKPDVPFDTLFERLLQYVSFTPYANTSGCPAIALPAGLSADGLPIGLQFSAVHGKENELLEIAFEWEQLAPWQHFPHPTEG